MTAAERRAVRRTQAGFTLVELLVSLLAGLIVAAGIVGLSREATNTFHEEARASSAEAALRAAVDRLRADLQRAGYMSTGNIVADPSIAAKPGGAHYDTTAPTGIQLLSSVLYAKGGSQTLNLSKATPNLSAAQPTPLNPDLIQVTGNMTTSDAYDVAYIAQGANLNGQGVVGNCLNIYLSPTSPAMYRLTGNGDAGASELAAAFQPDPTFSHQFIVRLVDDSGRSQYLVTCSAATGTPATGINNGLPYVSVDISKTPLRTAQNTSNVGALTGFSSGRAWVNPVQSVQWELTMASGGTDAEPAQFVNGLESTTDGGTDPLKYDLMRSFLDASNAIVPATSEIVAEYAVDLAFAFSVDTSTNSAAPNVVTYALDDATLTHNAQAGAAITSAAATPQRIRSIRARLAVRAAQPDRSLNIGVSPANYGTEAYTYRYCVSTNTALCSGTSQALVWARARTVTTEVALPNQARNFY